MIDRRGLLRGGGALAAAGLLPDWARGAMPGTAMARTGGGVLTGPDVDLAIGHATWTVEGRAGHAYAVNGTVPGPLIRLREGEVARIAVRNDLAETTSLHWHGLLVPPQYDGVPGVSYPGIAPGTTYVHEFPLRQSGTYWYHSHSAMQEPMGQYGPLIVDPAGPDPIASDREHVILLSDWSFQHAHVAMRKLKQRGGGYFNRQRQTLAGLAAGRDQPLRDRLEWGRMRMDPTDIADVTGSTYRFLINGHGPADGWTGPFAAGERVRLRFVNAAAMTIFDVRVPGLKLTVVAADGQAVRPVEVDEFQIGNAETYDVIVTPREDRAYALVAEAADRSGMALGTLAPRAGMAAPAPPLRARPLATMIDMGMAGMGMSAAEMGAMDHDAHMAMMAKMQSGSMAMRDPANAPALPLTPGVQTIAPMPTDRTREPGQGLADAGHRVLTYADLIALAPNPDPRTPSRALEIHLTGNMERYMWAFDGVAYSAVTAPIPFREGERVRVTLVNDTMMTHPIHLHGHFFELVTGQGDHAPRKHTVSVAPGGTVTFDLTADAVGDWAFHCHMMFHMHAGMFQVVSVRPESGAAAA